MLKEHIFFRTFLFVFLLAGDKNRKKSIGFYSVVLIKKIERSMAANPAITHIESVLKRRRVSLRVFLGEEEYIAGPC